MLFCISNCVGKRTAQSFLVSVNNPLQVRTGLLDTAK